MSSSQGRRSPPEQGQGSMPSGTGVTRFHTKWIAEYDSANSIEMGFIRGSRAYYPVSRFLLKSQED